MSNKMPDSFIGYETIWDRFSYKLYVTDFLADEDPEIIGTFLQMIDVNSITSFEQFKIQFQLFKAAVSRNAVPLNFWNW